MSEELFEKEEGFKSVGFYRIMFDDRSRNYYTQFHTAPRDLYPVIKELIDLAATHGIEHIWWFFEPYAEVTWYAENDEFLQAARALCADRKLDKHLIKCLVPDDGDFFNWYGLDTDEIEASGRSYAEIRKVAQVFLDNRNSLGMGLANHYERTLHVLANQLGMNYFDEGWSCLKQGLTCMAFYFLNQHAVAHVLRKFKVRGGLTF